MYCLQRGLWGNQLTLPVSITWITAMSLLAVIYFYIAEVKVTYTNQAKHIDHFSLCYGSDLWFY